jgi:hypothetical protein
MHSICRAILAWCLAVGPATTAAAQIDYRNLDDERPVRSEDAYPVDRYAFEVLTPFTFEASAGGRQYLVSPELEYGVLPNTQVGVKLPLAITDGASGSEAGIGGVLGYALYNFNTESGSLPALSLRADVGLPLGSLAGSGARATLKYLATRSWGRWRAHSNLSASAGPDTELGIEALPRWAATLAVDYTFFRESLLLIADLAALDPSRSAPTRLELGLGLRWQWRAVTVLDVGLRRRLSETGPDILLTVGLSSSMAFAWLMPGARSPEGAHAPHAH